MSFISVGITSTGSFSGKLNSFRIVLLMLNNILPIVVFASVKLQSLIFFDDIVECGALRTYYTGSFWALTKSVRIIDKIRVDSRIVTHAIHPFLKFNVQDSSTSSSCIIAYIGGKHFLDTPMLLL